jgi:hypothetical protein
MFHKLFTFDLHLNKVNKVRIRGFVIALLRLKKLELGFLACVITADLQLKYLHLNLPNEYLPHHQ